MRIGRINILDSTGHTELKWNPESEEECKNARETIQALQAQGFAFFLTDGRPADTVTAGGGTVIVRRLTAQEVEAAVPSPPAPERAGPAPAENLPPVADPRKGRPRNRAIRDEHDTEPEKQAEKPAVGLIGAAPEVVAVRQQRGG